MQPLNKATLFAFSETKTQNFVAKKHQSNPNPVYGIQTFN